MFGNVFGDVERSMRRHEKGCNQLVLAVLVVLGLVAIAVGWLWRHFT